MISFHGEFFWVDVIFFFSFTKFISCVCYFFLLSFLGSAENGKFCLVRKRRERMSRAASFFCKIWMLQVAQLSSSQHSAVATFFIFFN